MLFFSLVLNNITTQKKGCVMIGSCVVVEARIIYIYHTLSAFTFKSIVYVNEAHVTRQFMEYINILHMNYILFYNSSASANRQIQFKLAGMVYLDINC